eukprot:NODE_104_length_1440_cov_567.514738_g82_i0.p1 GENE.NODE_104_length_1440_cov_567.514738_g82_i0~~NODE_104_length_1440_cov_567.514738_g82_i0.p1  ORF type:complete len:428 (+),score=95.00 NODE_104_length_1440_cov_567.514738_g82_i0:28-1284(+)
MGALRIEDGMAPVHSAARAGHKRILGAILCAHHKKFGPQHGLEFLTKKEDTALHLAAQHHKTDCVALLLDRAKECGPEFVHTVLNKCVTAEGLTPLHVASKSGAPEGLIMLLIQHKAEPNSFVNMEKLCAVSTLSMYTALHFAVREGHTKTVRALLNAAEIDFDIKDMMDRAPLVVAARAGKADIVRLLAEKKADPATVDKWGNSALHLAVKFSKVDVVKELVKDSAKPADMIQLTDEFGVTPLHVAAIQASNEAESKSCTIIKEHGSYGMKVDNKSVVSVVSDGPAEKAGMRVGDIILSVNGDRTDPDEPALLTHMLDSTGPTFLVTVKATRPTLGPRYAIGDAEAVLDLLLEAAHRFCPKLIEDVAETYNTTTDDLAPCSRIPVSANELTNRGCSSPTQHLRIGEKIRSSIKPRFG